MQQVMLFENKEFGEIRTLTIDGEPYFVGKDVAEILGYAEPRSAVSKKVDDEDRGVAKMETPSGVQEMTIINESGFYSLVLSSKLPTAKKFKRWVTSEVLPSIRQTGNYISGTSQYSIEEIIQRTVTETIQAVVPEVMKAVMTGLVPFMLEQQKAAKVVKEKESESLENEKDYYTYETDVAFHLMGINKIELFPEEMLEQVNGIMEGMRREQKLNCNLIARYCKNLGYPVSKETVKEYFEKKFLKS